MMKTMQTITTCRYCRPYERKGDEIAAKAEVVRDGYGCCSGDDDDDY